MIVMSVSMGSFLGLPSSLVEIYGSDIKKIYNANGVPIYLGLVSILLSAFVHLMMTCIVILLLAPILFEAIPPTHLPFFFLALAIYILVSLSIGSILGLNCKKSGEADDDSTTCVFTLDYAFWDYVSYRLTARFS